MNWRILVAFLSIVLVLVLYGCTPGASNSTPSQPEETAPSQPADSTPTPAPSTTPESSARTSPSEMVPRISIEELLNKIESNADILIVDSRVDVEEQFDKGHIPGAIPVTLAQVTSGEWVLPADKDKEVIFYCS